jgi:hypothetical protein
MEIQEMQLKLIRLYNESNSHENIQKVNSFMRKIRERHQDFLDYKLYHLLLCSTPDPLVIKYDFPEEDSIEKFIESL